MVPAQKMTNTTDLIPQDNKGLNQIKKVLKRYFPRETKIKHFQKKHFYFEYVTERESNYGFYRFLTPDGVEYVLWNQKEYDPRWDHDSHNICLAGRVVENKIDLCLDEDDGSSTIADFIIKKHKANRVDAMSPVFPDFFAAKYIHKVKDIIPVIEATKHYAVLMKSKKLEEKVKELIATRQKLRQKLIDVREDIYKFIEKTNYE